MNYNVKYFLEQCLCSVEKACTGIAAEVFVVDNDSTDGSKEYLAPKFPNVIFKWNSYNAGFGKASNSVLSEVKGEHILFLNPDTIVPEDCFKECIDLFNTHKDCGAVGVRMVNGKGIFLKESKRSFPSPKASFFKMSGAAKLFPSSKLFAAYYAGHLPQNETNEVDALAGAFMMLSKEAIEKTKGFDEAFFMYGEDIDLSYRIQKAGLKNYYFAQTTILHFKGESTQKLSDSYAEHFYGAMSLFVKKHYAHKKLTRYFMLPAIATSKFLAVTKNKIQNTKKAKPNGTNQVNTAIAATHSEFNELLHLLKFATPSLVIAGRLGVPGNEKDNAAGNIDVPNGFLNKNKIGQVIFCEGVLSFKDIIHHLQHFPKKINYLFHAAKSKSIAGDGKNGAKGIFISSDHS